MKKKLFLLYLLASTFFAHTQNVGIGTTTPVQKLHVEGTTFLNGNVGIGAFTPAFPLSFAPLLGDKISLWSNSTNSYGFGIQGSLLQIHTDVSAADIAFGYGSSAAFTETMRIKGNGNVGIGTTTPGAKLEVVGGVKISDSINIGGQMRITSGSPGAGKVLTSDANGLASWLAPTSGATHTIGESYGGGIVFYVYDNGQHGLIAATADQSTGIQWYNGTNILCNAVRNDGISTGRINTDSIIAKQGAGNYAVAICAKYLGGGFGDWFLPSKYELNLLYLQKTVVGGFSSDPYWSSSELDNNFAFIQLFNVGIQTIDEKLGSNRVRAVRAF